MYKIVLIFCLLLSFAGCVSHDTSNESTANKPFMEQNDLISKIKMMVDTASVTDIHEPIKQKKVGFSCDFQIDNTCGVITIPDSGANFTDTFSFEVYNKDLTLWRKFVYSEALKSESLFKPYFYHYDNYLMMLRSTGTYKSFYKVIVNEEDKVEKLMSFNQKHLVFQSWNTHVTQVYAVGFSATINPLKISPSSSAKSISFDKSQDYHPIETNGNWMKLRDDNNNDSWIKWRNEKGELLVELFYDA